MKIKKFKNMLDFNDLFNDFFNRRNKNVNPLHDELRKLMETIANFKSIENEKKLEQEIDKELGKPTHIEELINDGVHYKKLTWVTAHGKFVKIIVTDAEEETVKPRVKTKPLEEQLQEAVEAENYELAIELRDKIKAAKKPKKTRKKKTDE
jgi:excinuclease UvrABC helicase subunit UvrB